MVTHMENRRRKAVKKEYNSGKISELFCLKETFFSIDTKTLSNFRVQKEGPLYYLLFG